MQVLGSPGSPMGCCCCMGAGSLVWRASSSSPKLTGLGRPGACPSSTPPSLLSGPRLLTEHVHEPSAAEVAARGVTTLAAELASAGLGAARAWRAAAGLRLPSARHSADMARLVLGREGLLQSRVGLGGVAALGCLWKLARPFCAQRPPRSEVVKKWKSWCPLGSSKGRRGGQRAPASSAWQAVTHRWVIYSGGPTPPERA